VPYRRRLWHVNVVCVIVIACVGGKEEKKRGNRHWGRGPKAKSGRVDSEHGQQGQSFAVTVHTKSHHSKKEGCFYIKHS
jgi:hypothetical protein